MASPIELSLRVAILRGVPSGFNLGDCTHFPGVRIERLPQGRWTAVTDRDVDELGAVQWCGGGDNEVTIYADARILSYRADLLIEGGCQLLAIECDGHDWHERTKQQAAYDKSRDRDLLKIGIPTIRFTGSEIHHSSERCANDVFAVMQSMVDADDRETMRWREAWAQGAATAKDEAAKASYEERRTALHLGFSRGIKHAVEALSVEFNDLHAEEHF